MDDLPLITTVAVAFAAAWLLGLLTQRIGLSPIVGYLLAGVAIGPHTPGFMGDLHIARQLAEMGVILLMFGVGLHFQLKDLLAVKSVAIPGAIGQSLIATLLGAAAFTAFGLPPGPAVVIGMAVAIASTVVLMRVLMDANMLDSPQGHIAVGWLLVQDVLAVVALVLIPLLGTEAHGAAEAAPKAGLWVSLGLAFLKLGVLVGVVSVVGSRVVPWVLVQVARLRSRELFTLTVLVISISMAAGSYAFFGASMALGAFLAGMVVGQSPVAHQAAADALPMRDAFAVLFFVSVGMLIDPMFLVREPRMILAALAIILVVNPLTALVIVAALGRPARTALTVALGLAQIGEFSFILSELARKHGLMPASGQNVLIASAIISITLNPVLFRLLPTLEALLKRQPWLWSLLNRRADRLMRNANRTAQPPRDPAGDRQLAVVVGFGPVGRSVQRLLSEAGLATVVIDLNMDTITELRAQGAAAVFGDASHDSILREAGVQNASYLILTLPHSAARLAVLTAARALNSRARVFVRAHYLREREDLESGGATAAVFEEGEAAVALARLVLADTGADRDVVERKVRDLRLQLIRIDEEYPLADAIAAGGIILELSGRDHDEVIAELAAAIPPDRLPPGAQIAALAIARERDISTDLGIGVAIPHARCPRLPEPLVVFGRSSDGIPFSAQSETPVRLVFLLVTLTEQPDVQLSLLAQVARAMANESLRERLLKATGESEILEALSEKPAL